MANVLLYLALIFASLSLLEPGLDGYAADADEAGGQLISATSVADIGELADGGDDSPLSHRGQGFQYPCSLTANYARLAQSPANNGRLPVSIRAPPLSTRYYA